MIILNFSMGVGYEGTPIITIITPEKVWNINQFLAGDNCPSRDNLQNVNLYLDCYTLESLSQWKPMFLAPLALTDIYVAPLRENPKLTKMVIQGRGFREVTVFTINGQQIAVRPVVDPATGRIIRDEYGHEIGSVTYNSSHEYAFIFPTPPQPPTKWVITARHNNGQGMEEVRKEVLAKDTPQAIM
jgi:hypothetical protein